LETSVKNLCVKNGVCKGVELMDGSIIEAEGVILTTGTFLGARVHIGLESREAGRYMRNKISDAEGNSGEVEPPSNEMAKSIR
jgi:tRNA U34 5-carboxymethylaminomethyl modifying enzyme MnmG/GidA